MEPLTPPYGRSSTRASIPDSRGSFSPIEGMGIVGIRCQIYRHRKPHPSETARRTPDEAVEEAVERARRRVLAWARGYRNHEHGSQRGSASSSTASNSDDPLGCGLSEDELMDLLYRDISPEDYDLLLKLDEKVAKKTCSKDTVEALATNKASEIDGISLGEDSCQICLVAFEDDDLVAALPCSHKFHKDCITKWLSDCKNSCPFCNQELS